MLVKVQQFTGLTAFIDPELVTALREFTWQGELCTEIWLLNSGAVVSAKGSAESVMEQLGFEQEEQEEQYRITPAGAALLSADGEEFLDGDDEDAS